MTADRQFWHYSKAESLDEVPFERGVTLNLSKYENLAIPGIEGVRDVYVVFESGPGGVRRAQWFSFSDLAKASAEFRRRESASPDAELVPYPLDAIEQKWGEDEVVAECRLKGMDLKVSLGGGLFYVDFGGRRTQVRLDESAVVRYLVHALEDGS